MRNLQFPISGFLLAIPLGLAVLPGAATASAILTYGDTYLGVNDEGHLNVGGVDGPDGFGTYGLWRDGLGDATSPGCECEGWGLSFNSGGVAGSGYANQNEGGAFGLNLVSFTNTGTSVTSRVSFAAAPDLQVEHRYGPSLATNVFQGEVRIINNGAAPVQDVVYRRVMDWDIPPTEFNEYVTHQGVEANLESIGGNVRYASDGGFSSANPLTPAYAELAATENVDFVDSGPYDHGSVFDFSFGDIAPGEARTFNIFYGSAADEAGALGAIATLQPDLYSFGQNSDPGGETIGTPATFLFAFGGVGGVPVGTTEDTPFLPFVIPGDTPDAPSVLLFEDPVAGGFWFDPPFIDGFDYQVDNGSVFTEVGTPSAIHGFGPVSLIVDGVEIAVLAPGEYYDFFLNGMLDVDQFQLTSINPILDAADPGFGLAFPTFLDFTPGALNLTMTPIEVSAAAAVPLPASLLLMLSGAGLLWQRRRSR